MVFTNLIFFAFCRRGRRLGVPLFVFLQPLFLLYGFSLKNGFYLRLDFRFACVDGDKCDYTICGENDEYATAHPEYVDEKGFIRNK